MRRRKRGPQRSRERREGEKAASLRTLKVDLVHSLLHRQRCSLISPLEVLTRAIITSFHNEASGKLRCFPGPSGALKISSRPGPCGHHISGLSAPVPFRSSDLFFQVRDGASEREGEKFISLFPQVKKTKTLFFSRSGSGVEGSEGAREILGKGEI